MAGWHHWCNGHENLDKLQEVARDKEARLAAVHGVVTGRIQPGVTEQQQTRNASLLLEDTALSNQTLTRADTAFWKHRPRKGGTLNNHPLNTETLNAERGSRKGSNSGMKYRHSRGDHKGNKQIWSRQSLALCKLIIAVTWQNLYLQYPTWSTYV